MGTVVQTFSTNHMSDWSNTMDDTKPTRRKYLTALGNILYRLDRFYFTGRPLENVCPSEMKLVFDASYDDLEASAYAVGLRDQDAALLASTSRQVVDWWRGVAYRRHLGQYFDLDKKKGEQQ